MTLRTMNIENVTLPTGTRKLTEDFGSELYLVLDYYAFERVRINNVVGTLYTTDRITDEVRALREKYSNVLILAGHAQYAPELKRGYVFVADKSLR